MNLSSLVRHVWDSLADGVASGRGPWREGLFFCFSDPRKSLLHKLTLRGANAATHTLKLRGARVPLKPGDAALWTFGDPAKGLEAAFEGTVAPAADADKSTWRLRVSSLLLSYRVAGQRFSKRFLYGASRKLPDGST